MRACGQVLQYSKRLVSFPIYTRSLWNKSVFTQRQLTTRFHAKLVREQLEDTQTQHVTELKEVASIRRHDDEINQDLFLDVLESAATKREAKAYLSRFGPQKVDSRDSTSRSSKIKDPGVNLGNLYLPVRAIDNDAVVSSKPAKSPLTDEDINMLHVALVKIRASQSINDVVLHGVGHTLSQLGRLGMHCIVVIDPEDGHHVHDQERIRTAVAQADRVVDVINAYSSQSARRLDSIVGEASVNEQSRPFVNFNRRVRITDRELLLAPLRRGVTPVIAPVGFTSDTPRHVAVDADEVMLGLTQEFTGLHIQTSNEDDPEEVAEKIRILQKQISLDRIIVLDPLGGIPADHRMHGSHVFINLDQEFEDIKKDLLNSRSRQLDKIGSSSHHNDIQHHAASARPSLKYSADVSATERPSLELANAGKSGIRLSSTEIHVKNMELMRNTLAFLPPSSSAFLITSDDVANSQSRPPLASKGPSVRTRRQKNLLIHNLLTDKPVYSSSLPAGRSSKQTANVSPPVVTSSPATFFKRGMPLCLIPDPLAKPWAAPSPSDPSISMLDPRIDLPRLVHLIEDSFNRKLDVTHYLNRIKDRIAGVIIAGEYEGGAILTWETPPGYPTDDPSHMVPYLDKFAVLKRSQGSGGVADIVFNAMVRGCFPEGVCWRSRKDNPINKWYFERAKGTHKIPNSNWTMFWTTEGITPGDGLYMDYKGVCETVQPSWADAKSVID